MNYIPTLLLGTGLLVAWVLPVDAARVTLTFNKSVELPAAGMRVKMIPDARETPLQAPQAFIYQIRNGDQERKEERYTPVDMWRQSQVVGHWIGRHDNELLLSWMNHPLPTGFAGEHATRATYDEKVANATPPPTVQTEAEATRWVSDFTGCATPSVQRVEGGPTRLAPVLRYRLDDTGKYQVAYAFRLNRIPGKTAGTTWMCALFTLNREVGMESACKAIETEFLGTLTFTSLSRSPADTTTADKSTNDKNPDKEGGDTRKQVLNSILNMNGWWYNAGPHYIILSNLKGSGRLWVEQLQKKMAAIRPAYAQCIPAPAANTISVIRIPATGDEYVNYVGTNSAWSGGMWVPARKELLLRAASDQNTRDLRKNLFRVAFHEGFHQYAFYAFNQSSCSLWFNEGFAQYFENATLVNGKIRIEEDPRIIPLLQKMTQERQLDLDRLFHLTNENFYNENDAIRRQNYALAWALVYYLKKGAGAEMKSPFADLLNRYVTAMHRNGGNAEAATETMLEGIDLPKLQLDFNRFWHSSARQATARRHNP